MILTDNEIRILCNKKKLIEPFCEDALQSESYDLTVGSNIAILRKEVRCIELSDQEGINNIYKEISISSEAGYVLSPKEYILAYLTEKITLPENITAHLRPRTRFTRLGLIVSDQHCNSTYSGYLKVGLYNATDYAIRITPGLRIAQIVFEELKSVPSEAKQYKNKTTAVYQNEEGFIGARFSDEIERAVDILLGRND